ncbi:P-loop NTPase [Balneolales bacterium ANBcel1]|nr:P-loop NTPase [Balneolales bacterium ANBcel1]
MTHNTVSHHPFIIATVSGKGGVGKSMASVNIAGTLIDMGYTVALLDADIGMSNCATLLNEPTDATVMHWVQGKCGLEDLPHVCDGLTLVTGSDEPGVHDQDPELLMEAIDQVLLAMAEDHDIIIIDTPAGSGELSLWALDRAQLGMVLLVDEPTAISDVYRFCKYILNIDPTYPFASVVNFAGDENAANSIHQRFNTILHYFMQQEVAYLGFIPDSDLIRQSVQKQTPVTRLHPDSPEKREFEFIAHNIISAMPEKQRPRQRTMSHD